MQRIVENSASGFGRAIRVKTPAGVVLELTGLTRDISDAIDPDTGVNITTRQASAAIRISAFGAHGIPQNVPENDKRPWSVTFSDADGNPQTYRVIESKPDRTIGIVVLILEILKTP